MSYLSVEHDSASALVSLGSIRSGEFKYHFTAGAQVVDRNLQTMKESKQGLNCLLLVKMIPNCPDAFLTSQFFTSQHKEGTKMNCAVTVMQKQLAALSQ